MHAGKLRVWSLFILINLAGFSLLIVAFLQGWAQKVVENDVSYITSIVPASFMVAMFMRYLRIRALNRAFDDLAAHRGQWIQRFRKIAQSSTTNAAELIKISLFRKLMWLKAFLWLFPVLGLLGTVIGTMVAFEASMFDGVDDLMEIGMKLVVQMVSGIGIALNTTLVGMIFMIWIFFNIRLLESESARLLEQILEAGAVDNLAEKESGKTSPTEDESSNTDVGDESATKGTD